MVELKMDKPVVHYRNGGFDIKVGGHATIVPLDHPSWLVTNGQLAHTSRVVSYDANTGDFETSNTRYVLVKD